jgi:cytochrome b pre-mRNA-processing protein 3
MFSRFFRGEKRQDETAAVLYGAIVAAARAPALYSDIGVADGVEGRFEMMLLHMALVTRRLEHGADAARDAGQRAFDLFCREMDNALREMGVSDTKVPKRMRQVGEAYFGRIAAYEPGLAAGNTKILAEAMDRTVFDGEGSSGPARALAQYSIAAVKRLAAQPEDAIIGDGGDGGDGPDFPDIGAFVSEGAEP